MERNLRLLIAYDGTDFHGWQRQPELRTIQGEIEQAAQRVVRHPVALRGSGRTDAGVHARGQVANFLTTCGIPADNLRRAIGSRLPRDISLRELDEVHRDFAASASALSKLYRYTLFNSPRRPVDRMQQRYCYHCWHQLDLGRLAAAAAHFVGDMDFSAMASAGCVRQSMVRTVYRCDVHKRLDEIRIDVEGNGFLYNQVRNMVGTLIEVGRGRWPVDKIPTILAGMDRSQAGPTAPANGLCLCWVRYPAHLLTPAAAAQSPPATLSPENDH